MNHDYNSDDYYESGPDLTNVPRRRRRARRRRPPILSLFIGVCLGFAVGLGALVLRSGLFFTPFFQWGMEWGANHGDSSGDYDEGFGFFGGGDVEINEEASEDYSLPPFTGDSTGLTIQLQQPTGAALTPSALYQAQLDATVSITVYAGKSAAYGSGMILTPDGYILTCAHVVDNTESAVVTLSSGEEHEALLVGSDTQTDLAVLKIDANDLSAVTFCDSDAVIIGEEVCAIGDPLGPDFRSSLTSGIISGLNRHVSSGGYTQTLLQTTAPVNSGNSGGPLFNNRGQVIGVVNMKMSSSGGSASIDNMGLAVPSVIVKDIVETLARERSVSRAVLGINCYTITETQAHLSEMPEGLWVAYINEASDCAAQGLLIGDIITHVNGEPVTSVPDFQRLTSGYQPGDTVTLTIWRDEALAEEARAMAAGDTSEGDTSEPAPDASAEEEAPQGYQFELFGDLTVALISSDDLKN